MEFIIPSIVEVLLLDKLGDVDMPELCGLRDKRTCGRLPRPRRPGHENVGLPSIKSPSNYHTLLQPLLLLLQTALCLLRWSKCKGRARHWWFGFFGGVLFGWSGNRSPQRIKENALIVRVRVRVFPEPLWALRYGYGPKRIEKERWEKTNLTRSGEDMYPGERGGQVVEVFQIQTREKEQLPAR